MKSNFDRMTKAELRAYVMAHRDDNEAFYKMVDRYKDDSVNQVWHPCPNTPEDWEKVPELIQEKITKHET